MVRCTGISSHQWRRLPLEQFLQEMHDPIANRMAQEEIQFRGDSGIALVVVLWILALMSVIAGSLVYSTRTEALIAGNLASVAKAEALADAGVSRAIVELTRAPSPDPGQWKADGVPRLWQYRDANIAVTITDESGKIDINTAPAPLLAGLLASAGAPEPEALADAILDWRDADDFRSLLGAEKAEYVAAGKRYGPANAHFETIEELRQVLGMTEELFRQIESGITVHSYQSGVNAAIAPRAALLALPGASAEQVDDYIRQRQTLASQGLPAPPFPIGPGTAAAPASAFGIRIDVILDDNARFVREAVVRLPDRASEGPSVLAWRAPSVNPDSIAAIAAQRD